MPVRMAVDIVIARGASAGGESRRDANRVAGLAPLSPLGSLLYSGRFAEGKHGQRTRRQGGEGVGASEGIGRAIAEKLAAERVRLSLCARGADQLRAVARDLEDKHGAACLAYPADLSRAEDIQGWVRATVEQLGGIDILINSPGTAQGGAFLDLPDQAWLDSWQLKLFGYIRVAREVFPHLVRRGGGRVVNVIGIAGVQPLEN